MLAPRPKTKTKGTLETMVCRIRTFMWAFGSLLKEPRGALGNAREYCGVVTYLPASDPPP